MNIEVYCDTCEIAFADDGVASAQHYALKHRIATGHNLSAVLPATDEEADMGWDNGYPGAWDESDDLPIGLVPVEQTLKEVAL